MRELYLDLEWFIGGDIFLIGYCFEKGKVNQLHHGTLTKAKFLAVIRKLYPGAKIYFYGPDIGVIEKYFHIDVRNQFCCINLLTVFRKTMPKLKSYKLADIEKKFGVGRLRAEYKKNIFAIFNDWKSYKWRKFVLQYNYEDVENLRLLKRLVCKKYKLRLSAKDAMK